MDHDIPMTPEEIGPEWLSRALAARFPGVRASRVEVVDAHAGTTGRAKLRVAYDDAAEAPERVFVKLPPGDPAQREMVRSTGMGLREARFYDQLAAEAPLRVPRPFFAASNEDGTAYIMLLEDLAEAGCTFRNAREGSTPAYTRQVVGSLARLHAHFWNTQRFAGDLSWVAPAPRHPIGPKLVERALDRFASEMPPVFAEVGRLYVEHTDAVYDLWDEGEATLVHGDAHIGNLFSDGERAGFLDWACLSRTPGIRDVSYFLTNSVDPEERRRDGEGLLRHYVATLAEAGVEPPSFEDLWRRHRRHAVYSWVSATVTIAMGDQWQP
ncbi:MAG: phosphotransferase, partial [Myxococcota bacterium]|nr:phosphotransferase [Myxococcota bacterium]